MKCNRIQVSRKAAFPTARSESALREGFRQLLPLNSPETPDIPEREPGIVGVDHEPALLDVDEGIGGVDRRLLEQLEPFTKSVGSVDASGLLGPAKLHRHALGGRGLR